MTHPYSIGDDGKLYWKLFVGNDLTGRIEK